MGVGSGGGAKRKDATAARAMSVRSNRPNKKGGRKASRSRTCVIGNKREGSAREREFERKM